MVFKLPLMLERQLYPVMVPSLSVPWPEKVTVAPFGAVLGLMESITAKGGILGGETYLNQTASAQVVKEL